MPTTPASQIILDTRNRECDALECTDRDFGGHHDNCRSFSHHIALSRAYRGELSELDRWRYGIPDDAPDVPPL